MSVRPRSIAQYFAQTGVMGSYYAYYLHNLQFILYARSMQGRVADTKKAAQQISVAAEAMAQSMPEMAELLGSLGTMAQLPHRPMGRSAGVPVTEVEKPDVNGVMASCTCYRLRREGSDQPRLSRSEQSLKSCGRRSIRTLPWSTNKTGDVMDLASAVLEARIQTSPALAVPKWKRAVAIQDG